MSLNFTFAQIPLFLARDESGDAFRVLLGAAFVAIYIIGTILSAAKKKKPHPGQREKSWEEILQDLSGNRPQKPQQTPPPLPRQTPPPLPTQSTPAPQRKTAHPKPAQPKKTPPRKIVPAAAPRPVSEPTHIEASAIAQMRSPADIITTEIGHADPAGHRHIAPRAAAVAQFLTPKNLRTQFILTEVLQPPLALRDNPK